MKVDAAPQRAALEARPGWNWVSTVWCCRPASPCSVPISRWAGLIEGGGAGGLGVRALSLHSCPARAQHLLLATRGTSCTRPLARACRARCQGPGRRFWVPGVAAATEEPAPGARADHGQAEREQWCLAWLVDVNSGGALHGWAPVHISHHAPPEA